MHESLDHCLDPITVEDLVAAADAGGTPKVSICLTTHRVSTQTAADRIVLGNLLRAARDELDEIGLRPAAVEELLAPISDRLASVDRWNDLAEGLVLLAAPRWSASYRLPYPVDPLAVVGDHFHLLPLLARVIRGEPFWLLALSRRTVRLWRTDAEHLVELDLPGVPRSMEEALRFEDREEQLHLHATAAGREGGAAVYHGHGGAADDRHAAFERFLRVVTAGLDPALAEPPLPVVVAATEDNATRFRAVSASGQRVVGVVPGNPDRADGRSLSERARPLLEARHSERVAQALSRVEGLRGTGHAVDDVRSVVEAALGGRVDTLLVSDAHPCWGAVGPDGAVTQHPGREQSSTDLVTVAALAALRTGATVLLAPRGTLDQALAGVLRY